MPVNRTVMKHIEYKLIRDSLSLLSTGQFREVKEILNDIESIKFVSKYLETAREKVICPHCKSEKLQRWGKVSDLQRYRCKDCLKTFNSLTNTPLARLKKKGRWIEYTKCMKEGISIRKAAQLCGISVKTSFHWRHRFLVNSRDIKPSKMSGIVEINEIPFSLSFKGSKKDYEEYKKINSKPVSKQKVHVLITKDRYLNTYDDIVMKFCKDSILQSVKLLVAKDTLMCSDNKSAYNNCFSELKFRHGKLDFSKKEYIKKEIVHLNTVLKYNNELLKWMERFKGVATKYLDSYLSWYRTLDEFNMSINPVRLLMRAKQKERYNHQ